MKCQCFRVHLTVLRTLPISISLTIYCDAFLSCPFCRYSFVSNTFDEIVLTSNHTELEYCIMQKSSEWISLA